jgi:hypothetical protein
MNYYQEAVQNQTNKVWDQFNKQDSGVRSRDYTDEDDTPIQHIGTLVNKTENIPDQYSKYVDSKILNFGNGGSNLSEMRVAIIGVIFLGAYLKYSKF